MNEESMKIALSELGSMVGTQAIEIAQLRAIIKELQSKVESEKSAE